MRILLFGTLFGISFGFFLVEVVSICLGNITWNPGWVGVLGLVAVLPMIMAEWLRRCARRVALAQALHAPVPQNDDNAPLLVAWTGIALTILGCIACVSVYLQLVAIPAFNNKLWRADISHIDGVDVPFDAPSFAVFYGLNDPAYASFSRNQQKCFHPVFGQNNCSDVFTPVPTFHSGIYGDLTGFFFDGSGITLQNQSSKVLLQTFVNYNSTAISSGYGDTTAPQNPYLYFAIFDSALNLTGFKNALECGIVALSEMPALGSTTLSVTPFAVNDTLNALQLTDETCKDIYDKKSHRYYTSQIASTGASTSASCDASSESYNPNVGCISQVIIRYGSTYLTTDYSRREKDNTEILIDISAIVGGVCFVFWFLGIFAVR